MGVFHLRFEHSPTVRILYQHRHRYGVGHVRHLYMQLIAFCGVRISNDSRESRLFVHWHFRCSRAATGANRYQLLLRAIPAILRPGILGGARLAFYMYDAAGL